MLRFFVLRLQRAAGPPALPGSSFGTFGYAGTFLILGYFTGILAVAGATSLQYDPDLP